MAKLHEIIAVDGDREKVAQAVMDEAATTFAKKHPLFTGAQRKLTMFDESRKNEEPAAEEFKKVDTTVQQKLDYIWEALERHLDCNATKEATNCVAKADLVVGDNTLARDLPATLLLSLENKLKKVREVYSHIPTLLPGIEWKPDPDTGIGIFVNPHPEKANKTEKKVMHAVLVPATDKHPAQVEKWNADVPVGLYETRTWSGMISPADKSDLLERIDILIGAIKQARQRANEASVVDVKIGGVLYNFIHGK